MRVMRVVRRLLLVLTTLALALALGTSALVAAWLAGIRIPLASGATYVEIVKLEGARSFGDLPDGPIFVALIGSDYRPGVDGERGDALHVLAVNPELDQATMVNVPRDTCTPVPGYGVTKINAAHTAGGPEVQGAVLGELLGVPVSYAVSVDFAGFQGIVNDLGGVTVDVQQPHDDVNSGAVFDVGEHHLDGGQALAFSRNRYDFPSGDLQRTENQGHLIIAGIAQLSRANDSGADRLRIAASLARHSRLHGVGLRDVVRLGELAYSLDPAAIRNVTIPTSGGGCSGGLSANLSAAWTADLADDGVLQAH